MIKPTFLAALLAGSAIFTAGSSKLPNFIQICRRSDPELNECLKSSVEAIRPYLHLGIPELGIPPCEPLRIPEIVMNQGKGAVAIQSRYSNIKIYGPTLFHLRSVSLNPESDQVKIKLWLPSLYMVSDYDIKGRILMLPIEGRGISRGNYSDIEATAVMQGEQVMKNGRVYFNVVDFFVNFVIGHANVYLSDLFNGDQQLGDAMNSFLNENWRNVVQDIQPILEKTVGDLFRKFSNRIYHKFPIDELLPP